MPPPRGGDILGCTCEGCLQYRGYVTEELSRLSCVNHQWMPLCEMHDIYHHYFDDCPKCIEEKEHATKTMMARGQSFNVQLGSGSVVFRQGQPPPCKECGKMPCACEYKIGGPDGNAAAT